MMIHRHGPRGRESNNTGQRHCRKHLRGHECVHNHRRSTGAINQLAANQTHILQQMAAMSIAAPPPPAVVAPAFNIPPVTNVAILTGGFWQGGSSARGGGHGRGCGGRRIRAGCSRNPFAMHMATIGCGEGDSISPHLADKPVSQELQSPHSCSHNSSIVTGLLPT